MTDKDNKNIESQQKNNADASKNEVKKPSSWITVWVIVSLLIAVLGMAGAAYVWWQLDQYKQQASKQLEAAFSQWNTQLQGKLDANELTQQVTPLVEPLQIHLEALEKSNKVAAQSRDALKESTEKLFELYGRDKNGWQLAEVEYLLRIAQHRLVIENDFQGAAKTLKAADDKISEIADPGLLPVRVAISDERVLLQTRKRPDLVGIVLSLSRISKQIPLLDLSPNRQKNNPVVLDTRLETAAINSDAPWQDQIVQFVKSLYKVEPLKKSLDSPVINIIDAMNTLEETLKLAKWAVLERDQQQYQQLMQQSRDVFQRYFDENNNYHREINTELKRLSNLEIRPELPDISTSLELLKGIMSKKEHAVTQPLEVNAIPENAVLQSDDKPVEQEQGEADE